MKRGGRFAIIPGRAFRDRAMTPKLRDVLGAVCYYANSDGHAVVRLRTVAELIDTEYRNLRRYVDRLEELGYLSVSRRAAADGREIASAYLVLHDADLPDERDRLVAAPEDEATDYPGGGVLITRGGGQSAPGGEGSHYPASIGNSIPRNSIPRNSPPSPRRGEAAEAVQAVFDHWLARAREHGFHRTAATRLTTARANVIRARLKEGYTVGDLCRAVDGTFLSEHHRKKVEWIDLTSLLGSGGKVDRHIARADHGGDDERAQRRSELLAWVEQGEAA